MSASDRTVTTKVFNATVDKMVETLTAQPTFEGDVPWTFEREANGLSFFQHGVFVERWVQA